MEKYKRGELVEPKNKSYFILILLHLKNGFLIYTEGVNDWNVAFEKAGFKNTAISCKKSLRRAKKIPNGVLRTHVDSAIVYKPSDSANASGTKYL